VIELRVAGIVVALLALVFSTYRYSRGSMRRLDLILAWCVSLAVVALGIYPGLFAPVFDAMNFTRGDNRQLLGVLVVANVVLFLLYLRNAELADAANRDIQRLVRALALREFDPAAHPELQSAAIIVVIPAYNEGDTIRQVLTALPQEVDDQQVAALVVDDGCTDDTEEIAREHGAVVVHAINRGQGAALLTGYQVSLRLGARIIAITDADGQTVLGELERIVRPIIQGQADFVNGSRTLGSYEADSAVRALGVRVLSLVVSILTRTRVTDVSSPFRAFRAASVARLKLQQPQSQASELLIEAVRKGLRYQEVPITMRRRQAGASRKPSSVRYAWGFVKAMMTAWLR
jgi:hypothetical protein